MSSEPGTVTVENMGLSGVTVQLTGVSSASAVTDDNGQYAFTGLRMGNYSVEISGFDTDEVGFSATAAAVTVGVGESKIVSFDGTYLRTAGIMGRVSVEGEGLEGVTVSLSGGPDATDMTTMTDAAGQYSFAKLRAGDYAVGISGYDTDDFEFEVTSQNVTVALGETANVPFEGVLLRTSGVSGRVSVEGIGLADVMVTLSMADAEDMTAMTDAGGLYAFSGLAAGDYTVAVALSDEQMAAYVFESTSMDVTVGDDETQIVNFEGTHATTASVTVRLFVDEAMKNDMHDEGEMMFPTAEMLAAVAQLGLPLALPITLQGPGVNDPPMPGMAMADGSVVFSDLKAGDYRVLITDIPADVLAALPPAIGHVLRDYAYGGPATGYPITLGVGEAAMQHAPVDITHTTVNVAVTLRGELDGVVGRSMMGVPGATVTLFADEDGENKVGEDTTKADEATGHAYTSIRFARAGTTGNTVHMSVSPPEEYWLDPTAGMQEVTWNPMSPMHPMPGAMPAAVLNDANILNLNVDVSVAGATITTDYGGGDALAGWIIGVMQGTDPTALEAVEGDDVPAMLGEDGMAAFTRELTPADLPATYHFGVAPDQPDALDGGEKYEGTTSTVTHTGLTLAGTMEADMIEVDYMTQSLVVGVHHERDQVMGYTGNVLDGDARDDGMVSLAVRYIDDNGRSRSFTKADWDAAKNTSTEDGVTTFKGLPADADVIVQASVDADAGVMLLDPDELAAYTATEANGITGGHFGAHGGYSHTVSLCPLMATNPQDFDECSAFAYVETHTVSGLVWRKSVARSGDDFNEKDPDFSDEVSISLTPVEGKNLAGMDQEFDALAKPSKSGATDDHAFEFANIAAGAYKLNVPAGWRARMGPKDATDMLGNALNPLASDVAIDVTPATQTVYGFVTGADGFGVDSVEVTVNNVTAMTDALGRYIAEGVAGVRGKVFVSTSREGYQSAAKPDSTSITFAMNNLVPHDIELQGVTKTATVSGTVTASGTNEGVGGVRIRVDGGDPENAGKNGLLTGDDGSFTAIIMAKDLGMTSNLSASKAGMSFTPESYPVAAHSGATTSGVAFTGYLHATISGRVVRPGGGPMMGVAVSATPAGGTAAEDADTTGVTGTFTLSVPFGNYTVAATADDHTFGYPNNVQTVNVGPGQSVSYGDIQGMSPGARNLVATRQRADDDDTTEDIDESERFTGTINVGFTDSSEDVPDGYNDATYQIQTNITGMDADWTDVAGTQVTTEGGENIPGSFTIPSPSDDDFMVRVNTEAEHGTNTTDNPNIEIEGTPVTVAGIDPTASNVIARRQATATDTVAAADGGFLYASWDADSDDNSQFRVVIEMAVESLGGSTVTLVAGGGTFVPAGAGFMRSWSLEVTDAFTGTWTVVGSTQTVAVTDDDLNGALMVRVDARQDGVDEGEDGSTDTWTEDRQGTAVAVAAKES